MQEDDRVSLTGANDGGGVELFGEQPVMLGVIEPRQGSEFDVAGRAGEALAEEIGNAVFGGTATTGRGIVTESLGGFEEGSVIEEREGLEGRIGNFAAGDATNVPRLPRDSRKPRARSAPFASRMVERPTPNAAASSASDGNESPAFKTPSRMRPTIWAATW
jgi:hypothetical protein